MPLHNKLSITTRTDKGRVRETNEDSVGEDPEIGLLVLCDGMGGHNAGEVASAVAVNSICEAVRAGWERLNHDEPNPATGASAEAMLLRTAIEKAHQAIRRLSTTQLQYEGMGTTAVTCLLYDGCIATAHVGDSRLYRLRGGMLEQLTRDHSLVEDLVAKGFYSREEAQQNIRRNILTRALGSGDKIEVDIKDEVVEPGDIYLLCSDGLTDMLSDNEIRLTLQGFSDSLDSAAGRLIDLANEHGGKDNVSVALARVDRVFARKKLYKRLIEWL